ncbi:MAG: DNA recombination protein RmuC [Candidatus Peregrinibacteria bacterium Greene0416_62]|nr:MAG: DNA recombination protein RmuC [Candidatus Peregrinibacteria bacterium Greene0416_62]TSC97220.1 MAG: DNA recombination protein RmuC [Candidatus Peregrinibacteria bacterium Greene1014_49]
MDPLSLLAGIFIGLLAGVIISKFLLGKTMKDAEAIAESLSSKVVSKQTEKILQLAESKLSGKKEVIDGTLKSMKTDLDRVEKLMHDIDKGNTRVDNRLQDAAISIKNLTETTQDLKTALASNSSRGQWGERMAEDVLRLSGLIEGVNYVKQEKLATGSRPDFTFLLPKNLKLNMDVKFPFNNYQVFVEATTEAEREKAKKEFLADVKRRIKEVQTRDYINPEDQTMDYVLLFVPNEQIYTFINEIDPDLLDEAMRGKTILCSPMTLYAILAVIRQSIDSFSVEIKSKEMLSLFGGFKQQWEKFKEQMTTVQTRFDLVHKGYEELTGTRTNMLDRKLTKIEELRTEQSLPIEGAEEVFEKVSRKQLTEVSS